MQMGYGRAKVKLPVYAGIPKMHMLATGLLKWRFLSYSSDIFSTSLAKALTWLFKALHPALEVLWHSMPFPLALRVQYAQHWVLQNIMAFIPVMKAWNSSHSDFQHFTTPARLYDFERLCTNLDHVDLKRRLCNLLGLIFDLHPGPVGAPACITVSRDGPATWRSGDSPNPTHFQTPDGPAHTFDLQSARAAVCFLIDHSYILVGGHRLPSEHGH